MGLLFFFFFGTLTNSILSEFVDLSEHGLDCIFGERQRIFFYMFKSLTFPSFKTQMCQKISHHYISALEVELVPLIQELFEGPLKRCLRAG